jgi:hypothetical protein
MCMASPAVLRAQSLTPGLFLSRSVSGQFVIQSAPRSLGSPLGGIIENNTNYVRLDPGLLTVSCERIKQLVWRELNVTAPWRGKVFLRLYPANSGDDPIVIDSEQYRDGWQYGVRLPNICHRERYVRAMVSVILLEVANRDARLHSSEVPTWLTEGLSREIWVAHRSEIILPPPQFSDAGLRITTLLVNARKENPLEQAHQQLCAAAPLNFQQLSWPTPEDMTGERGELYRSSAQLFVHQLLTMPDGPARMRAMVENLSRYYNWQFGFFDAFRDLFQQTLDVEKWWSLQLVHFTGRELAENWSPEASWEKLDQSIRSSVQIRIGTNELPLHAEVALQTIVRDWPAERQTPALQSKLGELKMLRPRLVRELIPIVDEYCNALETYLQNLNRTGLFLAFRKQAMVRRSAAETIQQLDQLDNRRAAIRSPSKPSAPAQPAVTAR